MFHQTSLICLCLSCWSSPLSVCGSLPLVSRVTPLRADEFARELHNHPDQVRVAYVLQGLREGFRIGFVLSSKLKSAKRNKPLAFHHPKEIDNYLANEVSLGRVAALWRVAALERVAGPFSSQPFCNLQVSSFGVIPRKGQSGGLL